jgi:hypothetical protein
MILADKPENKKRHGSRSDKQAVNIVYLKTNLNSLLTFLMRGVRYSP